MQDTRIVIVEEGEGSTGGGGWYLANKQQTNGSHKDEGVIS